MFIDKATIKVQAGSGGNGAVSFHREKFVAAGGPDGGDGGRGGNIVLQGCESINTLIDFKYKRKFIAQNGKNGGTNRCFGKSAPDLVIKVPVGTVVKNAESGQVTAEKAAGETATLRLRLDRFPVMQSRVSPGKALS